MVLALSFVLRGREPARRGTDARRNVGLEE